MEDLLSMPPDQTDAAYRAQEQADERAEFERSVLEDREQERVDADDSLTEQSLFEAMERSRAALRIARMNAESAQAQLKIQERIFSDRAFRYANFVRARELWRADA